MEAFLLRTAPASSIVNPAAIHITSAPQMRKAKVLKTNCVSPPTPTISCAWAAPGRSRMNPNTKKRYDNH